MPLLTIRRFNSFYFYLSSISYLITCTAQIFQLIHFAMICHIIYPFGHPIIDPNIEKFKKLHHTSSDWDQRGPCSIYHIPSENVPLKSEFTKNVKEWPIEILKVNRNCPIIKILILITAPLLGISKVSPEQRTRVQKHKMILKCIFIISIKYIYMFLINFIYIL